MIKNILFCLFILLINTSFSQSYVKYYSLCNEADSLGYLGENKEALKKYKEAFKTVGYIHSKQYKNAYHLSIKLNSFMDAHEFGKMVIVNSGKKEFIKTQSRSFKKSEYYKLLKDSCDFYLAKYNDRVNQEYIKIIDSLIFIDQYIIRNNKRYKEDFEIDKSKLPSNLFDLDSSNWNFLYSCIQQMGFPSEKNVGYEAYNKVLAILHHNLRLEENEKYHEEIFEFVRKGDYLPEHMMVWYEQFQMHVKAQTFFTTWDENISAENLNRLDSNRRRFYLKGINSFDLKKNGRKMNAKW